MHRTKCLAVLQVALLLALPGAAGPQDAVRPVVSAAAPEPATGTYRAEIGKFICNSPAALEAFQEWASDVSRLEELYLLDRKSFPRRIDVSALRTWLPDGLRNVETEKIGDFLIVRFYANVDPAVGSGSFEAMLAFVFNKYLDSVHGGRHEAQREAVAELREEQASTKRQIEELNQQLAAMPSFAERKSDLDGQLFELELEIATTEARLESIRAKLEEELAAADETMAQTARNQEYGLQTAEKKLAVATENLKREKQLAEAGMSTPGALSNAELTLIEAEAELAEARAKLTSARKSTPLYDQLRARAVEEEISLAGLTARRDKLREGYEELEHKSAIRQWILEELSRLEYALEQTEDQIAQKTRPGSARLSLKEDPLAIEPY